ncbi:MAG TPA: hypothetical protein PLN85_00310 [archaeon]|jgi:hypothetical protein|nr:hypothetical protein [archaeon]
MANLKLDLINKIKNDKYYDELELVRLAADPNMLYKKKIEEMQDILGRISLYNNQINLIEQYFRDEQPQQQQILQQKPVQQQERIHQGQSHGE